MKKRCNNIPNFFVVRGARGDSERRTIFVEVLFFCRRFLQRKSYFKVKPSIKLGLDYHYINFRESREYLLFVVTHIYPPVTGQRQTLTIGRSIRTLFNAEITFKFGGIRTCLEVSSDPMFPWISSNSCPLNLLLVRSHQAEIIIVKRQIQGRNNVIRLCD